MKIGFATQVRLPVHIQLCRWPTDLSRAIALLAA